MPTTPVFDIPSPPTNTVILAANRSGRVQFTVNNVSGRPLHRVRARLTPVPDANAGFGDWLKLAEEGYREFGIASSLQYTAQIQAPADTKAGTYTFRLDVWEDANTDDTLASGPSVTFTVPQPEVKPKSGFPWWDPGHRRCSRHPGRRRVRAQPAPRARPGAHIYPDLYTYSCVYIHPHRHAGSYPPQPLPPHRWLTSMAIGICLA